MKRSVTCGFLVLVLGGLVPAAGRAEERSPWIHVQVDDKGGDTKVNVNLPLSALDLALDLAKDDVIANGRIKLEHADVSVADLRRMWTSLRASGDAELATVEQKDSSVRVSQKAGRVLVQVDEKRSGRAKVRVDLPASAVDALLAGEGDTLNLRGAIAELRKENRGEMVQVDDGDTHVRIWIE